MDMRGGSEESGAHAVEEDSAEDDFDPLESIGVLRRWLDRDCLLIIVKEYILKGYVDVGNLPSYIASDPADFVMSFYASDLLKQRHIREFLVMSLLSRDGQAGVRYLARKMDIDPSAASDEIRSLVSIERWQPGGPLARAFTDFFGFPREFAGTRSTSRVAPVDEIQALVRLPEMHEYQAILVRRMMDWLMSGKSESGAMLVLPTGTGKTRVACELMTRYMRHRLDSDGKQVRDVILWIAHTKELCDQAHETISRMWESEGRSGSYLNVYRFWGNIDAGELIGVNGVVVAGVQKLNSAIKNDDATILSNHLRRRLRLVIVDEAHLADNPSYLEVLRFLAEDDGVDGSMRRKWMLLGLSATPFKSDERRNPALRREFPGTFRLDEGTSPELKGIGAAGVFKWMQEMHYLKHNIEYSPLVIPKPILLRPADREYVARFRDLSDSVLTGLALDAARNDIIVAEVLKAIGQGFKKMLLFACSVNHCHLLKASFRRRGVKSFTVTGEMSKQERTRVIAAFRKETTSPVVLINFAILTTGFDDPKIDAVFITRPTFSRVLYHQMVGRGLRGEKNGGSEGGRCLLLDVQDNFVEFKGLNGVVNFADEISAWTEDANRTA